MDRTDAVSTLNELIETCRDGEQGFRTASEAVAEPDVQRLFASYAPQRAPFAVELARLAGSGLIILINSVGPASGDRGGDC